jgi:hypothetical protein
MFKIWAKVMKGEKIIKQLNYEGKEKFTYSHFFSYLAEICYELDIPTPVLLKTHIFSYAKFRTVRFLPRDFTEQPEFDRLILDNISF